MTDLPSAEIDLEMFGYTIAARANAMDLSQADLCRLTGLSRRQVSFAFNGKPICAGATHVLAVALAINLDAMLPPRLQERIASIRRLYADAEKWEREIKESRNNALHRMFPVEQADEGSW